MAEHLAVTQASSDTVGSIPTLRTTTLWVNG